MVANREKPLPHKLYSSRQVYVHALLVQHLYSVRFQYVVWSNIRNSLDAKKAEKSIKIY